MSVKTLKEVNEEAGIPEFLNKDDKSWLVDDHIPFHPLKVTYQKNNGNGQYDGDRWHVLIAIDAEHSPTGELKTYVLTLGTNDIRDRQLEAMRRVLEGGDSLASMCLTKSGNAYLLKDWTPPVESDSSSDEIPF